MHIVARQSTDSKGFGQGLPFGKLSSQTTSKQDRGLPFGQLRVFQLLSQAERKEDLSNVQRQILELSLQRASHGDLMSVYGE